jgi:hypothetical protein
MPAIQYAIGFNGSYVGIDGLTPADGYHYVASTAKAVRFNSPEECSTFMTVTGPQWLQDYVEKGILRMVTLHDGVPVK